MGQAWYAKRGDREVGPVAQATLEKWASVGRLRPSDHVRQQDEINWRPASEAVQFKKQPTIADRSQPDAKPSPDHVRSSATPFGEWYKERWLSKLHWYFQIPLWLIYGFVWIPIWYVATATPSGGIKRRWGSLSSTGKAVACLPLLLLAMIIALPNSAPHQADGTPTSGSTVSHTNPDSDSISIDQADNHKKPASTTHIAASLRRVELLEKLYQIYSSSVDAMKLWTERTGDYREGVRVQFWMEPQILTELLGEPDFVFEPRYDSLISYMCRDGEVFFLQIERDGRVGLLVMTEIQIKDQWKNDPFFADYLKSSLVKRCVASGKEMDEVVIELFEKLK